MFTTKAVNRQRWARRTARTQHQTGILVSSRQWSRVLQPWHVMSPFSLVLSLLEGLLGDKIFNWQYGEKETGLAHCLIKLSDSLSNKTKAIWGHPHGWLSLECKMACAQTNASTLQETVGSRRTGKRMISHFVNCGVCSIDCSLLIEEKCGQVSLAVLDLLSVSSMQGTILRFTDIIFNAQSLTVHRCTNERRQTINKQVLTAINWKLPVSACSLMLSGVNEAKPEA